jgi:hypothetical protein
MHASFAPRAAKEDRWMGHMTVLNWQKKTHSVWGDGGKRCKKQINPERTFRNFNDEKRLKPRKFEERKAKKMK